MKHLTLLVTAVSVVFALGVRFGEAGQTEHVSKIQREVEQSLQNDKDLRRLEVSVEGSELTLSGEVPHLWAKMQAIEKALKVNGVKTVASDILLPEGEPDEVLAKDVARSVRRYVYYTMWDDIGAMVDEGVVTLFGSVTPDHDKKGELFERIARIRGVQDLVDDIEIQAASNEDDRLRALIARRLFSNEHFERFGRQSHKPFHIIVNLSSVTLVGYVQSQIEYVEIERIVGQTEGVLRVKNQLEVLSQGD